MSKTVYKYSEPKHFCFENMHQQEIPLVASRVNLEFRIGIQSMGKSQRQGVFFSLHTGLLFSLFRAIFFISFLSRSRCASYSVDLSCQRRLLPEKCWVSVFILPQLLVSLPHLLHSFIHTVAKHLYLVTQRHRKFSIQWPQAWSEKCEGLSLWEKLRNICHHSLLS